MFYKARQSRTHWVHNYLLVLSMILVCLFYPLVTPKLLLNFKDIKTIDIPHKGQKYHIKNVIYPHEFPDVSYQEMNYNIPVYDERICRGVRKLSWMIVYYSSAAVREFTRLYHFRNAIVTSSGVFSTDSMVAFPNWAARVAQSEITMSDKVIDHLIIGKPTFYPWGHFITDSPISALLEFPEEIVNKCQLYFYMSSYYFRDNLQQMGFGHLKFANIEHEGTLVKNLYVSAPNDLVTSQSHFCRLLREKLFKLYNVKNITPTKGVISNRPSHGSRYIQNIDDWIKAIKTSYPKIDWKFYSDHELGRIKETVAILSEAKYLVTPSGSNAMKCLYMQEDTGMCMLDMEIDNWSILGLAQALGIWVSSSYNPNFPWIDRSKGPIDIAMNIRFLGYLIYAVENKKWPKITQDNVSFLFEQNIHREILAKDPSISIMVTCDYKSFHYNVTHNLPYDKTCRDPIFEWFKENLPLV